MNKLLQTSLIPNQNCLKFCCLKVVNMSVLNVFTNQYSVNKTLRFELKPVGKTVEMLEKAKIFQKDEVIQHKYKATKPYIDQLHREFISEALQNAKLNWLNDEYLNVYKCWKTNRKDYEKELKNKEQNLRAEIVELFNKKAKDWSMRYPGLKNDNIDILFEEDAFERILKVRFGDNPSTLILDPSTGKQISIFDSWKGFKVYFSKFFKTRENFYKDDGTETAIATRIVNQNLRIFCDNVILYENLRNKIDFSEVFENFGNSISIKEFFDISSYNSCLLQNGIDSYNKIIGGETLQNGEKKKGLNELINEYRQKTREKVQFFKKLYNQIHYEKGKVFLDEIKNEKDLIEKLERLVDTAKLKTDLIQALFKDFYENQEKYNLYQIYLSKQAINTISYKWTDRPEAFREKLYQQLKKGKLVKTSKPEELVNSLPDFIALGHIKDMLEDESEILVPWKVRYFAIQNFAGKNQWNQFLAILNYELMSQIETDTTTQDTNASSSLKSSFYDNLQEISKLLQNFTLDDKSKITIK
ncbi:hypothetical protein D6810_03380, partial [Candidatus Dojkabacteria bacterium]